MSSCLQGGSSVSPGVGGTSAAPWPTLPPMTPSHMPHHLVWGHDDTAAKLLALWSWMDPYPNPDDNNPLLLLSSAPVLEGACNCGSSQMQELLVNMMGDSGSTHTSDPCLMTCGLWVWVRWGYRHRSDVRVWPRWDYTERVMKPSVPMNPDPEPRAYACNRSAYQWPFLLLLCRGRSESLLLEACFLKYQHE